MATDEEQVRKEHVLEWLRARAARDGTMQDAARRREGTASPEDKGETS